MIQAMIDIGSNTVRMAIYHIEAQQVEMILKKKNLVGLAAYLRDGIMQPQGIDKVCEVLQEYQEFLHSFQISQVVAFTTAALRNARNSQAAVAEIVRRTGIPVQVIAGEEEARLDFIGATHDLPAADGLLIDIGGGSTEVVWYQQHQIVQKTSLIVGSLALKTRYAAGLLPTAEEVEAMKQDVRAVLAEADELQAVAAQPPVCGIGGTYKGACALYNLFFHTVADNRTMMTAKFPLLIEHYCQTDTICLEDTIRLMKAVPDRIHTIIPGLVIADVLAEHFGSQQVIYSDSGMREGYIYDRILNQQ